MSYLNPSLPSNQKRDQISGWNLSYGFLPNVFPSHIPNPSRGDAEIKRNVASHIGWKIGDNTNLLPNPTQNETSSVLAQTEIPCQAIHLSDAEKPTYSFKYHSVSKKIVTTLYDFILISIQTRP